MKSLYVYQQALIFLSDYMIRIVIFERDKKKKAYIRVHVYEQCINEWLPYSHRLARILVYITSIDYINLFWFNIIYDGLVERIVVYKLING